MTRWWEFQIAVPPEEADAVASTLLPLAYGGVVQEPALVLEPGDEGFAFSSEQPTVVKVYLPQEAGRAAQQSLLETLHVQFPHAQVSQRELEAQEWSSAWQRYFKVRHVGRLVLRPAWQPYHAHPGEVVLTLEPGMAFGTGDHPTTRACLRALAQCLKPGAKVRDVGTGSGVLAIAVAKLGAAAVLALDTDPLAVDAARENCARNGVEGIVTVLKGSLDHPSAKKWGKADLLLANLNSQLHVDLARAILGALAPGGIVVASGIGGLSLRRVTAAYRWAGAARVVVRRQGEWRTLLIWGAPAR